MTTVGAHLFHLSGGAVLDREAFDLATRIAPTQVLTPSVRTPVARLDRLFAPRRLNLWAKLEHLQPSGSMKERSAQFMLAGLEARGVLGSGATVVASTSGNLGISLARQCAIRGLRMIAVVDDCATKSALGAMKAFGAGVHVVDPGPDQNRLQARLAYVAQLVATTPGAVDIDQYSNSDNPRAHRSSTMPELVSQLGSAPARLYVATSTVGTLLGCQQAVDERGWATQVIAVDAVGSVLFGGSDLPRHLPGIGAGVESKHAAKARPDEVRRVDEAAMVRGARRLACREGLLAGASTGAVVSAIEADLDQFDAGALVAMIVHDGGVPYLDTVYDDDWVRANVTDPDRALSATTDLG